MDKARTFLAEIAQKDGSKNRAAPLALTELEHRAYKHGLSGTYCTGYIYCSYPVFGLDLDTVISSIEDYFTQFGDKACCFEDLKAYLDTDIASSQRWRNTLASHRPSFVSSCLGCHSRSSFLAGVGG